MRLRDVIIKLLLVVLLCCCVPSLTLAHSPYIGEECRTTMPDGSPVRVVLHYGDGIFWADPVGAVVIDNEGRLVAVGPITQLIYLICSDRIDKVALDMPHEVKVAKPDVSSFTPFDSKYDDLTKWYPDDDNPPPRGLSAHSASVLEIIWYEIRGLSIGLWVWFAMGIAWFAAIGQLLLQPWYILPEQSVLQRIAMLFFALIRIAVLPFFLAVSAYLNLLLIPTSIPFFVTMIVVGGFAAVLLRRKVTLPLGSAPVRI